MTTRSAARRSAPIMTAPGSMPVTVAPSLISTLALWSWLVAHADNSGPSDPAQNASARSTTVVSNPIAASADATSIPMNPPPTTTARPLDAARAAARIRRASASVRSDRACSTPGIGGMIGSAPVASRHRSKATVEPSSRVACRESRLSAATDVRVRSSMPRRSYQLAASASTSSSDTSSRSSSFDSGGRLYGGIVSDPTSRIRPSNFSRRNVRAARTEATPPPMRRTSVDPGRASMRQS